MNRNLRSIAENSFDLIVIGGGIYGACIAWEAVLRGLSVALFEKGDFCGATSANSLKIIHGGFRYLQNGDIQRMRESIRERRILMGIAPHLVHPLPVLIPNYGHATRGREAFQAAILLNELISADRNRLADPEKRIPAGRTISKQECLRRLPGLPQENLSGGTVFYDAQVYNSERLVLAFLFSARQRGAQILNYARVCGFLREGDRAAGVEVEDVLSGERFTVRAKMIVNAAGPWIGPVLSLLGDHRPAHTFRLAKAVNILTRKLFDEYAVGLPGENEYLNDGTAAGGKKSFLFVAPWRGRSLIGTIYSASDDNPDKEIASGSEKEFLLKQINRAYPPAGIQEDDIVLVHRGLLPVSEIGNGLHLKKHYRILDHRMEGIAGLITVEGVKYTTARDVAQAVVDRVFAAWGRRPTPSTSAHGALLGGQIERFADFLQLQIDVQPKGLPADLVQELVYNYGCLFPAVLDHFDLEAADGRSLPAHLAVRRAQVRYAVREELAAKLEDVVFRRTGLGSAGQPDEELLAFCAEVMATELGWDSSRRGQELAEVKRLFQVGG